MRKKMLGIGICMLIFLTIFPAVSAIQPQQTAGDNQTFGMEINNQGLITHVAILVGSKYADSQVKITFKNGALGISRAYTVDAPWRKTFFKPSLITSIIIQLTKDDSVKCSGSFGPSSGILITVQSVD